MSPIPSPEETAAITAAVERFWAEMAAARGGEAAEMGPWQRAALIEGVGKTTSSEQMEGGLKWLS